MARQSGGPHRSPRVRSGTHHFTASEQLAIQFVLRYLVNVAGVSRSSGWERPRWCNFTWFTSIRSTALKQTSVEHTEYGDVETLERAVIFRLTNDPVVIVSMWGQRHAATPEYPNPSISWAIKRIRYLTRWGTGHEGTWVDQTLVIASTTGLPPQQAPIG